MPTLHAAAPVYSHRRHEVPSVSPSPVRGKTDRQLAAVAAGESSVKRFLTCLLRALAAPAV